MTQRKQWYLYLPTLPRTNIFLCSKKQKECELLQGLSHPNIVKVLDHVQTQDTLCFVFEYITHPPIPLFFAPSYSFSCSISLFL